MNLIDIANSEDRELLFKILYYNIDFKPFINPIRFPKTTEVVIHNYTILEWKLNLDTNPKRIIYNFNVVGKTNCNNTSSNDFYHSFQMIVNVYDNSVSCILKFNLDKGYESGYYPDDLSNEIFNYLKTSWSAFSVIKFETEFYKFKLRES